MLTAALSFQPVADWFAGMWDTLADGFTKTFIRHENYKLFIEGFGNTLFIAVAACLLGCVIGVLVAVAKVYNAQTGRLRPLNALLNVYLAVFRGTPILVQLLILYYIVFKSVDNALLVAIIGFGINSGAYVAEVVRAGIMAIDPGQTEAGRSLGLSAGVTMRKIILPQAFKNILPALGNEFIALLKETSVAGFITVVDLTRAGDLIRAQTMDPYFSLFFVAGVYLVLVLGLTWILGRVERRLRRSDRR